MTNGAGQGGPVFPTVRPLPPSPAVSDGYSPTDNLIGGAGSPKLAQGQAGDYFLDMANLLLYGPKTSGSWGTGRAIGGGASTSPVVPKWSNGVSALGDSITLGGSSASLRGNVYLTYLTIVSQGRLRYVQNAGVAGERSDQILARLAGVLANSPDVVVVLAGTNDSGQYKTLSEFATSMRAIFDGIKAAGRTGVVCTVPPVNFSADVSPQTPGARKLLVAQYNLWLRRLAVARGLPLVDVYAILTDPTGATSNYNVLYNDGSGSTVGTDGIHPNGLGQLAMARAIWTAIKPLIPENRVAYATDLSDPYNLVQNPLFATGNAIVVPALNSPTTGTGGSLANVAYRYVLTSRTLHGEGAPSAARTVTPAASGTVTLTWSQTAAAKSYNLYRALSTDAAGTEKLVATITAPTGTFTDDGTAVLGVTVPSVVEENIPTSWVAGSSSAYSHVRRYSRAEVPGNVVRLSDSSVASWNMQQSIAPSSTTWQVGDILEVSGWFASQTTTALPLFRIGLTGSGGNFDVLSGLSGSVTEGGFFNSQFTVPAGTTNMVLILQLAVGSGWVEFGAVTLRNLTKNLTLSEAV